MGKSRVLLFGFACMVACLTARAQSAYSPDSCYAAYRSGRLVSSRISFLVGTVAERKEMDDLNASLANAQGQIDQGTEAAYQRFCEAGLVDRVRMVTARLAGLIAGLEVERQKRVLQSIEMDLEKALQGVEKSARVENAPRSPRTSGGVLPHQINARRPRHYFF